MVEINDDIDGRAFELMWQGCTGTSDTKRLGTAALHLYLSAK